MKLNDPRIILIAGLATALNLSGWGRVRASEMSAKKPIRLSQAQSDYSPSSPSSGVTAPVPALKPTPDPYSSGLTTTPQTVPAYSSPVTTVPMQLGTQPSLTPAPRAPMGMFYGEQDRLDSYNSYDPYSPRPLPSTGSPANVPVYSSPVGVPVQPVPSGVAIDGAVVAPPASMTDRFGIAPPPGTLGQTYKRRSRPIEDTKHPRVGIVEVHLPEEVDVTAKGLKIKWTGKVWRLESDSLIPGIPHIYEVKASWGEGTQPQVRTVRLIMGRIVDLEF